MAWFKPKMSIIDDNNDNDNDNTIRKYQKYITHTETEGQAKTDIYTACNMEKAIVVVKNNKTGIDFAKYTPDRILIIRHFILKTSVKRVDLEMKRIKSAICYQLTVELIDGKRIKEDFLADDADKMYSHIKSCLRQTYKKITIQTCKTTDSETNNDRDEQEIIHEVTHEVRQPHEKRKASSVPKTTPISTPTPTTPPPSHRITYPELHNIDMFPSSPAIQTPPKTNEFADSFPVAPEGLPSYWEAKALKRIATAL